MPMSDEVIDYEGEVAELHPQEHLLILQNAGIPPHKNPEVNQALLLRYELT